MIEIIINGKKQQIGKDNTLEMIIAGLEIQPPYAVMINRQHIVRRDYVSTILSAGDEIDIITPMQGG